MTRARSDYSLRTSQARLVFRPVIQQIGAWQHKIAMLRGVVEHSELLDRVGIAEQLDELSRIIAEQQAAFDREVAGLSADIADHDRIRDARKALDRSHEAVATIRAMLPDERVGSPKH